MITAILLVASIVIAVVTYSCCVVSGQISRQEEEYECKYNDNVKCYEKCCNYCLIKSECECCCGGDCKHCGGYSVKVKVK